MNTIDLKTTGMHCSSCSMLIQMNLEDLPGVVSANADFTTGVTRVEYDAAVVRVDELIAAVVAAGYEASIA